MAFLNRLFNRKGKTELTTSQPLRRSLTDPVPPSSSYAPRGNSSDKSDNDMVELLPPPSRMGYVRGRRAGCELGRSKTSIEAHASSNRSSSSSAPAEPLSTSADGTRGQYRQMKAIHRSRLHTIMAAQDRSTKRPVVLKTFVKQRLGSTHRARLESEIQHLRALIGVPGVVRYLNHFEDDECMFLVLERSPGTTLIELVANCGGRVAEQMLVPDVLIPLTMLLADLHKRGIVHRHIKPEHVLCNTDQGTVTLLDFAEAANKKQRCLNNRAGSLEYMAPEVLDKPTAEEVFHHVLYNGMSEEELPQYDEKADVWSLGAIVFEALTGCQPFLADSPADMAVLQRTLLTQADASTGHARLFSGRPLSPDARSFLTATLALDPLNRSSAEALLGHPLLQRHWPRYVAKQAAVSGSLPSISSGGGEVPPTLAAAPGRGEVVPYHQPVTVAVAPASPSPRRTLNAVGCGSQGPAGTAGAKAAGVLLAAQAAATFPVR